MTAEVVGSRRAAHRPIERLPLPLALLIERAIEAGLTLDPDTRARLAALDGRVIRVRIARPALALTLIVGDGRVRVPSVHDGEVDLEIAGSVAALRSLMDGNEAVYRGEVTMTGDIGLAQTIKGVVGGLDPDWQDALAPVFGDALVHRLDRALSSAAGWFSRTRGALVENGRDWLEDEVALVATPEEVRDQAERVDELRAGVDRFEARLARAESRST